MIQKTPHQSLPSAPNNKNNCSDAGHACSVTGQPFTVTPQEMELRKKLGIEGEPDLHPIFRFMQLGAFWQHWNLHKRKCDKTGNDIISVYPPDCPYPVWHKDEWIKHASPPGADFDPSRKVFPQLWDFFQNSPIAHNIGTDNDNCEYTDDWWHSRNCYLSHSGLECEDVRYCYRVINLKNCEFCTYGFDSQLSCDLINCHNCFQVRYALNCWHCRDVNFCYDCRNCSDCFLSSNLRNKQYYFGNQQLTKEEYEERMQEWNLQSHQTYERAKSSFKRMLNEIAWHRATFIEECENSTGNYLVNCKDCENCFFVHDMENCINMWRGAEYVKDSLDVISAAFKSELLFNTCLPQEHCYRITCCMDIVQSQWMDYCTHCFQCRNCFGCCGLAGKEYYIFNKPYSKEDYGPLREKIIEHMKKTGEYGKFFPGSFAANTYDESLSGFYWPLNDEMAKQYGFRISHSQWERKPQYCEVSEIPDTTSEVDEELLTKVFWDETANRPFQIQKADIALADTLKVPLPHSYYSRHLQENFRMIPFTGSLRVITCPQCQKETHTSWPEMYDGRILCEECYFKEVY